MTLARVVVGGVAPIPLRLRAVEEALVGRPVGDGFEEPAAIAVVDVEAPPMTAYKLPFVESCLVETLERAAAAVDGAVEEAP